jgi:hypothetical protein
VIEESTDTVQVTSCVLGDRSAGCWVVASAVREDRLPPGEPGGTMRTTLVAQTEESQGTFRGRDAIRGFFAWSFALATDVHFEGRGFGRHVAPPFVYLEAVESLTMTDGTTYSVPLVGVGEFNASGQITRWVRSSDRWSMVVQGARQMRGPLGVYFRWFLRQIDQSMTKGMPTPVP